MTFPVRTSRPTQLAALLLTTTAFTGFSTYRANCQGLPTGYAAAYGNVGFQRSSGTLTINQSSQNAIVNYNSFSIGRTNTVNINQPNSRSAILNRVTGNTPSTIAGHLNANGQVYLVNPNGIAITKSGVVKVGGGFVASSLGMSDWEFRHGRKHFKGNGSSATVSNAGTITIGRGGYAALIGGEVRNSGTIAVPMGKVGLGSGEMVTLDVSGDGFLEVAVPTARGGQGALIQNSGAISAAGGMVVLDAATARAAARNAVNISGTIDAHSISGHSGSITIGGGAGGRVAVSGTLNVSGGTRYSGGTVAVTGRRIKVSGTIDASGRHGGKVTLAASNGTMITGTVKAVGHHGEGGAITVSGLKIALAGAKVDASGKTGGGTIKIGGDLHGDGTLSHADNVTIDAKSAIMADATGTGNGGNVVVWSDLSTGFAGTISAKGGPNGGDAGSVEVSSHGFLSYTGTTDLTAPMGAMGTLLLDPYNITISDAVDSGTPLVSGVGLAAQTSNINITTLEVALNTANVSLSTGAAGSVGTDAGNIMLSSALTWTSSATLTLTAAGTIALDAPISAAAGGLTLDAGGAISAPSAVSLARFTLQSGAFSQITPTLPAFSAGDFELAGGTFVRATGGAGTTNSPYTLTDIYGVQGIGTMLTQNYQLAADIDASQSTTWYGGQGFAPIGSNDSSQFTGTFDGAGHTIANLTVNRAGDHSNYAGLFGDVGQFGTIENVGVVGGTVGGYEFVGGLVGRNHGTVTQSYATSAVNASIDIAGGLVGENDPGAHISQAYATGEVGAQESVGGLVGINQGIINQAYATGAASAFDTVGGLVGDNRGGGVSQAYATGAVSVSNNAPQTGGGFAGVNQGVITSSFFDSYTTGKSQAVGTQTSGSAAVTALTSDPTQSSATNYAYTQSAYAGLTFVTSPTDANGPGFYMVDGATRPFLSFEYSTAITNSHQLELINLAPAANYTLANNIDLGPDLAAVGGKYPGLFAASSFSPIGGASSFSGAFDGAGHTISNLVIDLPAQSGVGLFYYLDNAPNTTPASVSNLGLIGANVTGSSVVGTIAGFAGLSSITNSYATGAVTGTTVIGGLVGRSSGTITQSHADVSVTATGSTDTTYGGLVGTNNGSISQSYATGAVTGYSNVGGLVGTNNNALNQDYATGAVTGTTVIGGLVGTNNGVVNQSYATGAVTGSANVGGLIGIFGNGNVTIASTTNSFYDSYTTGQSLGVGAAFSFAPDTYTPVADAAGNVSAVTSDPAQSGAANYAYKQSAYTGFTFVTSPAGAATTPGFYMVDGSTRPFLSSEYSTTITNSHQLELINLAPGASYTLANNIDLGPDLAAVNGMYPGLFSASGFAPIGVDSSGQATNNRNGFTGAFNGASHTISNLAITLPGNTLVGLFGDVGRAGAVKNIGLIGGSVIGDSEVGGVAGENDGAITQAYSTAIVSGSLYVGGLVGENIGTITVAYATGNVYGTQSSLGIVGGLVGENDGTITQAYATGAVTGLDHNADLGGLVGTNDGTITQTYATGAVGAGASSSDLGGLIGLGGGPVTSSYWDVQSTGQTTSGGGTAIGTTAQAMDLTAYATTYAGFDFQNVWSPPNQVGQNSGSTTAYYPQLYALEHITTVDPTGSRQYGAATAPSLYYGVQAGDYVTTLATVTSAATGTSNAGTSYATTAAGALTTSDGSVTTASGAAYRYVYLPAGTLTVTSAVIDVTGLDGVDKTYDGSLTVTGISFSASPPAGVFVHSLRALYGSRNASPTPYTFTVSGLATNDSNYVTSTTMVTDMGTITPEAIIVTAATNTKTYDGTTSAAATPTLTSGTLYDSASFSETYDTNNAGTGKTLTPAATISDGNSGANYTVTYVTNMTGVIDARPVILMGAKTYDGTTNVPASQIAVSNTVPGDSAGLAGTGVLASKNAGTEALTSTNGTLTGLTVSNANYTVTGGSGNVLVLAEAITVTSAANTKTYDGTTSAAATPTVASGLLYDSASFTETYDNADAGTGKTLTPTATISDGNGGANYTVTYQTSANGTINARPVTLAGTMTYNGSTNAPASELNVTNMVMGDTVGLTGTGVLASRNAGSEALTSTNSALTGLSVANTNYTVTGGSGSVTVSPEAITVTATAKTKTYDGTTTAAAALMVTGTLYDSGTFSESYDNANAGTGKTLTPTATIRDGNMGKNYTVTYFDNTMGEIDALPVTIAGTMTYNGSTGAPAGELTVTNVVMGDTVGLSGTGVLASKNAGSEMLTSTGGALTGLTVTNANYTVTGGNGSVTVSPEAITVTAVTNTKTYDGDTSAAAVPTVTSGAIQTGDSATYSEAYDTADAGTGKTLTPRAMISDGNMGSNYTVTYVANTTGVINARAVTAVMLTGMMTYDGTTNAPASELTVTNMVNGDTVGLTGTGVLQSKNVGAETLTSTNGALTGLTVSNPNYTVTGGSGSVTVTPEAIIVTAAANTKTYDGTTTAAATPTVTSGMLYDSASFSETTTDANAGAGKVLTPMGTINDGNMGDNYTVIYQTSMNGVINAATLTYTANAASRTYGAANPALSGTVTGFVDGQTQASATMGTLTFATQAASGSNVGADSIDGSGLTANNGNYTFVQAAANANALSIIPAPLTVAGAKTYDATTMFVTNQLGVAGAENGETVTLTSGSGTSTSANAGTYNGSPLSNLAIIVTGGNMLASNYSLPATGSLVIGKATINVAGATGVDKTYDATTALPNGVAGFIYSGVFGNDATVTASSAMYDSPNAGPRMVDVAGLTISGTAANDYMLSSTSVAGSGTISAATVDVTALGGSSIYGTSPANPGLSATGLQGGQSVAALTGLSNAFGITGQSHVGSYTTMVQGTLTNANYVVGSTTNGSFTVTPRSLSIAAGNQSRAYNTTNPPLTYTIGAATATTGLVNGDVLSGALTTTATQASPSGPYPVTQGTLAATADYTVAFTPGTLTVGQQVVVVTPPIPPEPPVTPPATPEPVVVDLSAVLLASTADRAYLQAQGDLAFALPLLSTLSGDSALASQIIRGLGDPRFDAIIVCVKDFCTIATPREQKKISQLEMTPR